MNSRDVCDDPVGRRPVDAINWLIRADYPEVLAIEKQSPRPHWTDEDFLAHLKRRNTIGNVATVGKGTERYVAGFVVYHLRKKTIDILNIGVLRDCRRQGIGRQIMDRMFEKLVQQGRTTIQIMVSDHNLECQKYLQSMGFICDKIDRGFYPDGGDGYRFTYERQPE